MIEQLTGKGYSESAAKWIVEQIEAGNGSLSAWLFRAMNLNYVAKINAEHGE